MWASIMVEYKYRRSDCVARQPDSEQLEYVDEAWCSVDTY